ncbi:MAG TPA: hypothetical protein VE596_07650 [Gaiellaceae bacterium]|nr:hypothetical protein [Gaiellaceae bacterium]
MKKPAPPSVGAGVELVVAEMADAVTPRPRSVSDPALELIEEIYREQASRFRRVAAAIVESAEAADDVVQGGVRERGCQPRLLPRVGSGVGLDLAHRRQWRAQPPPVRATRAPDDRMAESRPRPRRG